MNSNNVCCQISTSISREITGEDFSISSGKSSRSNYTSASGKKQVLTETYEQDELKFTQIPPMSNYGMDNEGGRLATCQTEDKYEECGIFDKSNEYKMSLMIEKKGSLLDEDIQVDQVLTEDGSNLNNSTYFTESSSPINIKRKTQDAIRKCLIDKL